MSKVEHIMTLTKPTEHSMTKWAKVDGEIFQVYNFDMNYMDNLEHEKTVRFYAVPLGAYFKPRRQTQTREKILRDYAMDTLEILRRVLPGRVI
jgi:hypothetical protein